MQQQKYVPIPRDKYYVTGTTGLYQYKVKFISNIGDLCEGSVQL